MSEAREKRQVKFWGPPEAERLKHGDVHAAVEEILDDMYPTPISEMPETIDVVGYAPMEISVGELYEPLEDVIERIEEEYGDPEGMQLAEITDRMKSAQDHFLRVVRDEYQAQCWACEEITRLTINVREWIEKNRREWLKEAGL